MTGVARCVTCLLHGTKQQVADNVLAGCSLDRFNDLGKPAWLLNYNDEPHWPLKLQNRKDFNIRMQQFFDHYLMDAPMPLWMKEGVPAIHKGILQGYELPAEGRN